MFLVSWRYNRFNHKLQFLPFLKLALHHLKALGLCIHRNIFVKERHSCRACDTEHKNLSIWMSLWDKLFAWKMMQIQKCTLYLRKKKLFEVKEGYLHPKAGFYLNYFKANFLAFSFRIASPLRQSLQTVFIIIIQFCNCYKREILHHISNMLGLHSICTAD